MIGSDLITKDSFKSFLEKTFINKDLTMTLLTCFYENSYKANLDMVMFLLYNEYFPVDMLKFAIASMANTEDNTSDFSFDIGRFENELINIINYSGRLLGTNYGDDLFEKNVYSHIKYDFFRNYVTTLTFKYYASIENYYEQMSVIYSALTPIEKDFLAECLFIDDKNFNMLIRKQIDDYTIDLAEVEKYDNSFEETYGDDIDQENMIIKNRNLVYYDILSDGYYKFVISNGEVSLVKTTRNDNASKKYLLANYRIVCPNNNTDINSSDCLLYGRPSITNLSSILNLTNATVDEYWYYNNGEKYSKRDLLRTILNKISLGTIHY